MAKPHPQMWRTTTYRSNHRTTRAAYIGRFFLVLKMHKQDKKWVHEQINKLPAHLRKNAYSSYCGVYDELINSDTPNLARRTANTRLRKYVEKVLNSTTARQAP